MKSVVWGVRTPPFWIAVAVVFVLFVALAVVPGGDAPAFRTLAVPFGVPLCVMGLMHVGARIDANQLVVWFFPLVRRRLPFDHIVGVQSVRFRPLREYGGWGVRRPWRGKGWAFTLGGSHGVRVDLDGGSHLLFQVEDPDEFAGALVERARLAGVPVVGSAS